MQINPEILRNYWQQFSLHRIIMMPAIIFILVYAAYSSAKVTSPINILEAPYIPHLAGLTMSLVCYGFIAFVWGSYSAAGAVIGQINDKTWDYQRLSSITPWSLSWGTVFGSTLYVWYGTIISLGFGVVFAAPFVPADIIVQSVIILLIAGLYNTFLVSLVGLQALQTSDRSGIRRSIGYRILGLIIGSFIFSFARSVLPLEEVNALAGNTGVKFIGYPTIYFYGYAMSSRTFLLISLGLFTLWALFGVYRTMRTELKMRSIPWGWTAFLLFLFFFYGGYSSQNPSGFNFADLSIAVENKLKLGPVDVYQFFSIAFIISIVSCYLMFLSDNISITRYRMMKHRLNIKQYIRAAELIPRLAVSYIFTLITGIVLIILGTQIKVNNDITLAAITMLGFFLFILRDIAILHYFSIASNNRRAVLATIFYLVLLYAVIPWFINSLFNIFPGSYFYPIYVTNGLQLIPILFQVVIALGLLYDRWTQAGRPIKQEEQKLEQPA